MTEVPYINPELTGAGVPFGLVMAVVFPPRRVIRVHTLK